MTSMPTGRPAPIEVPEGECWLPTRLLDEAPHPWVGLLFLTMQRDALKHGRINGNSGICRATFEELSEDMADKPVLEWLSWLEANGWIKAVGDNEFIQEYLVTVNE